MCLTIRRTCVCGREEAQFMHRDNILPESILVNLYCPSCRSQASWDGDCMTEDNGWVLEFDIEGARFLMWHKGLLDEVTPDFIFDQGYCSWNGMTPHDLEERAILHAELAPLLNQDRLAYINALKTTMLERVHDLKTAGWRKAQNI
ncbi:hypothetical protein [Desulfobacca acetoxidans]